MAASPTIFLITSPATDRQRHQQRGVLTDGQGSCRWPRGLLHRGRRRRQFYYWLQIKSGFTQDLHMSPSAASATRLNTPGIGRNSAAASVSQHPEALLGGLDDSRLLIRRCCCVHNFVGHSPLPWVPSQVVHDAATCWRGGTLLRARAARRILAATADTANGAPLEDEAGPLYPEGVTLLYIIYVLNCVMERGWRFALPLLLATAEGGFGAIALLGLVTQLTLFVAGPSIGMAMDKADRSTTVTIAMVTQAAAVVASALIMYRLLAQGVAVQSSMLYPALIAASIVERVAAFSSDVSLERDWVVALCGVTRSSALAKTNGNLRRADQVSEFGAALAVGYCVTQFSPTVFTWGTILFNVGIALIVVVLVQQAVNIAPRAMRRKRARAASSSRRAENSQTDSLMLAAAKAAGKSQPEGTKSADVSHSNGSCEQPLPIKPAGLRTWLLESCIGFRQQAAALGKEVVRTWGSYFRQPVRVTSFATVVLYFNAVLSPGGLMTAYLTKVGCSGTGAAIFRSACAVLGIVGTVFGSYLIVKVGVLRAGMMAVCFQAVTLVMAAVIFFLFLTNPGEAAVSVMTVGGFPAATAAFCAFIVASRAGLWMFDMAHAQILQQSVPSSEMSTVGGVELSFCSLAELCMLAIAAVVADSPGGFSLLVVLSCVAVLCSAVMFCGWVASGRAEKAYLMASPPTPAQPWPPPPALQS